MDVLIIQLLHTEFLAARFFDTSSFNAYFTTNCVASIWEVLLNIYFIADPRNKGLSAFIYMQSNNLDEEFNSKQNLRPEKGICSYLVKFYCTINPDYVEYTGLFCVSLFCACVHMQWKWAWGWGGFPLFFLCAPSPLL